MILPYAAQKYVNVHLIEQVDLTVNPPTITTASGAVLPVTAPYVQGLRAALLLDAPQVPTLPRGMQAPTPPPPPNGGQS